ncbi:MAG: hypothetical protein DMF67_06210 [Acidobacteria bacterium]|nr:MAG: hypothetical protein DMF67_06210 [Acidobacteriota bacterium]
MYPHLPISIVTPMLGLVFQPIWTKASPSEKSPTESNCGVKTTPPEVLTNAGLPPSVTRASPSWNSAALSNRGAMRTRPSRVM